MKALGHDEVKIQPKTSDIQKKTQFHTYKPKQDKSFRVVLKNKHHSREPNEIKQTIESLEHEL